MTENLLDVSEKPRTLCQSDYDAKAQDYFECVRPEMLPFIPADCKRVLDVGCGGGGFGESLKKSRTVEVWGVEPMKSAADNAKSRLDRVICGSFDANAQLPARAFDCVIFNDVLEHMLAPEEALCYARTLLTPDGVVVASIPNIRSFPTLWTLLFHGKWEYMESGILDKTHLRFFTKSSIVKMFDSEGYAIQTITGINAYGGIPNASGPLWAAYKAANALFLGRFLEMRFLQFAVVAKPSHENLAMSARRV